MKVLYLTLESYRDQAIIQSQVINLFKSIISWKQALSDTSSLDIVLTTFDPIDQKEEVVKHESVPSLKHIMYRNRGASRNVLYLVYKVFTSFRDVDIVHVRSYLPMIPALLLKLFFRKKVIFDMRGVLPEETLLRKGSRLQYKLLWWLEAVSSRYADKIVVVSNAFREIMLKRRNVPADRVVVIPTFSANSVKKSAPSADVPDLKKDIFTQDNILFVYSGAFEKWQCAEEVVIFFKVVQQYIPEARLVVLSRNVQEFEALLKQHFETGLYYVSNARNEHLRFYLQQCNYGMLFRKPDIINQVAAPIKFKDYLSAGLPVIATSGIGDYADYIREHRLGFVIEQLTVPVFEKTALAIKSEKNGFDAKVMQDTADQLFDVMHATRAYLSLYKDLMK